MGERFFGDMANPTASEIVAWAYADEMAPMEDFDLILAFPEYLPALLATTGDPACPARGFLLGSLYCLIGHSDLTDPRIAEAVESASQSDDDWLKTWGHRAAAVLADPGSRNRDDWCSSSGKFRTSPSG